MADGVVVGRVALGTTSTRARPSAVTQFADQLRRQVDQPGLQRRAQPGEVGDQRRHHRGGDRGPRLRLRIGDLTQIVGDATAAAATPRAAAAGAVGGGLAQVLRADP